MKVGLLALIIALTSSAHFGRCEAAEQNPPASERLPPERFQTKLLKVFAAKDGDAIFRAYLVKWKDQEVIVSDPLSRSNFTEGDIITVLAMNHPFPQAKESHRLLGFTIVPSPR